MAWCEANRVDICRAGEERRLVAEIKIEEELAAARRRRSGNRRGASRTSGGRRSTAGAPAPGHGEGGMDKR